MQIRVVQGDRLTAEEAACWSALQRAEPALHSPFFRPEYTQAIATLCPGVEIAVIEEEGETTGFFPYQRLRRTTAGPVGGMLCDFQGPIARPGLALRGEELLRRCGLAAWHFDHLVSSREMFCEYEAVRADSPYIDVSRGFEAYKAEQRAKGSQAIPKTLQKARKAGRELGPLRFEPQSTDANVLDRLIEWKVEQYHRLKDVNYLAPDWTRSLLSSLLARQCPAFAGVLSALYVGERLAAAHLGLRSHDRLHAWFPAYDPALAEYSPGLILWVELIQACPGLGIDRIDLGKGDQRFKTSFMSGADPVAEGSVDLRRLRNSLRKGWLQTRDWIRSTPLRAPARVPARMLRRVRAWLAQRGQLSRSTTRCPEP